MVAGDNKTFANALLFIKSTNPSDYFYDDMEYACAVLTTRAALVGPMSIRPGHAEETPRQRGFRYDTACLPRQR